MQKSATVLNFLRSILTVSYNNVYCKSLVNLAGKVFEIRYVDLKPDCINVVFPYMHQKRDVGLETHLYQYLYLLYTTKISISREGQRKEIKFYYKDQFGRKKKFSRRNFNYLYFLEKCLPSNQILCGIIILHMVVLQISLAGKVFVKLVPDTCVLKPDCIDVCVFYTQKKEMWV